MIRVCGLNIATEKKERSKLVASINARLDYTNLACIVNAICLDGHFAPENDIQDSKVPSLNSTCTLCTPILLRFFHKLQLSCLMLTFENFVPQSEGFAKVKWS